jgi:hypothetical protein
MWVWWESESVCGVLCDDDGAEARASGDAKLLQGYRKND